MVIETVTAVAVVKTGKEILEILHLLHVGHLTGHASYKKGSSFILALEQKYQRWLDQKNPARQLKREAITLYDYQDAGTRKEIKSQAEDYLITLQKSIKKLEKAQKYFLAINTTLIELVKALQKNDNHQCQLQLLTLETNFKFFLDKLDGFLDLIAPPLSREKLYIADLLSETKIIERFNKYLKRIRENVDLLEKTEQLIANQFQQGFNSGHTLLPAIISSSVHPFEKFQQDIKQYLDLLKIERSNPLENNPNWLPLLTEAEQIEVGQRIFLHGMNVEESCEDEKLLIAQIFLRKSVSNHLVKQMEVDELAYEMACSLRNWQIIKCKQLIRFLITLEGRQPLPNQDMDGLLAWLKTKKREQNPVELFTEILVSPCLFSECNLESAHAKLSSLFPEQDLDELIKKHQNSFWGSIWERNDTLIQLPKSFNTKILQEDCLKEDSLLQRPTIVSAMMRKLATALIVDLKRLQLELMNNKFSYSNEQARACKEKEKAFETQKSEEHDAGVERIKQAETRTITISSFTNSLFPYLYQAKRINEEEQKLQVPTLDDLSHVIYRGVDPNGVCLWKDNSQSFSRSNQLVHHFLPEKPGDTKTKAWLYARDECQVNRVALFSDLFSSTDHLILSQAVKNNLSVQAILKDNKQLAITAQSKALSGLKPETMEKTEAVFQELKNYYVLALVRAHPEYQKELSIKKQLECLIKNFFKSTPETGKERLKSVEIFVGDLCVVFSAKDAKDMGRALKDFDKNYEKRCQEERKVEHSVLYSIIKKMIEGPLSSIRHQISEHLPETSSDRVIEQQSKEQAVVTEDKRKETAQVREHEEHKEKENEHKETENKRKEKEVVLEKIARLETLTEQELQTLSTSVNLSTSRVTLFSKPSSSQTMPTEEVGPNPVATKVYYGS
ncbi:hypothetical protein [Rickettsiella endosymbiont of Miltochrista miniata]|uniref:hypothetical protein n=1 Tax=Rickettsiella endosymbiont of Miltochrista miniata TaxID=3066239 RepID=UPI00313D3E54